MVCGFLITFIDGSTAKVVSCISSVHQVYHSKHTGSCQVTVLVSHGKPLGINMFTP